jgi:hypothetical protein
MPAMDEGWWVRVDADPPFRVRFVPTPRGRLDAAEVHVTGPHAGAARIDTTTLRRVALASAVARANALATQARIRAGEPVTFTLG